MKHLKVLSLVLAIIFLTLLALAGCGSGISQADYDTLLGQKTALEADKQTLQTNYNSLQADYDSVNDELNQIKKVYPPRDFSSRTELENWLTQNTVSEQPSVTTVEAWIGRALEIQEDALLDGYVVSVDYDYNTDDETYDIFCTTVISGYVWYWYPGADDIYQDTNLVAVK